MSIKDSIIDQFRQVHMLMERTAYADSSSAAYRGQGRILSLLMSEPEVSQKDLAGRLDISRQGLAELLGKLEKNGYIERYPSENDKRMLMVKLTEDGKTAAEVSALSVSSLTDLLNTLNEKDQIYLSSILSKIIRDNDRYNDR